MRCRKVRSFLSAYCSDELTGRKQLAVREHLSTCSACRKEEAFYRSMKQAGLRLDSFSVSADFNTGLLNRIAEERFSETRTKAYLPRRVPAVRWRQVGPAAAAVTMLVIVGISWLIPGMKNRSTCFSESGMVPDDLYRTVQPINNPNLTASLHKGWSLDRQLQQMHRMARISNSITAPSGFGDLHLAGGLDRWTEHPGYQIPYATSYHRIQPVVRVYQSSNGDDSEGDAEVY